MSGGMQILVLGSGAREHALCWRLARDEDVQRVRTAPGNGGTAAVAETVPDLNPNDPTEVARHAGRERYDLVVVGPEAPLAAGVPDALEQAGIPVFGPSRAAARLETSKLFAKQQLGRAGVPTAPFEVAGDHEAALGLARSWDAAGRAFVVKADWLAAGKGVVVPGSLEEAEAAIQALFHDAAPGAQILVEERLTGREVSAFALVSGEHVVPLAVACDYKRLADADAGPNTGGMGAYAPVAWFGRDALDDLAARVFEPIAWLMARDGNPYRGVLYAGLMVTKEGPMVLEFNARFGDPEAQVVLPLIDGDLAAGLLATAHGDLSGMEGSLGMTGQAAVCVVVASEGYPEAPIAGRVLGGVDPSAPSDDGPLLCFHAGTRRTAAGYETTGGRVVSFVGLGSDLRAAREHAYAGVAGCELEGGLHRSDIALAELSQT
jgi:phosphoribosylamine---glycine ligase